MTQRIVRVRRDGATAWGLVDREDVFWLGDDPYIQRLEPAQKLGAFAELEVLAPVAPSKILGVGMNYTADADTPPNLDPIPDAQASADARVARRQGRICSKT